MMVKLTPGNSNNTNKANHTTDTNSLIRSLKERTSDSVTILVRIPGTQCTLHYDNMNEKIYL